MPKSVAGELAGLELPVERGCPFAPPAAYERLREQAPISKVRLVSGGEAWWCPGMRRAVPSSPTAVGQDTTGHAVQPQAGRMAAGDVLHAAPGDGEGLGEGVRGVVGGFGTPPKVGEDVGVVRGVDLFEALPGVRGPTLLLLVGDSFTPHVSGSGGLFHPGPENFPSGLKGRFEGAL